MRYTVHNIIAVDSDDLGDHINRLMADNGANRLHSCLFMGMIEGKFHYVTIFEIETKVP